MDVAGEMLGVDPTYIEGFDTELELEKFIHQDRGRKRCTGVSFVLDEARNINRISIRQYTKAEEIKNLARWETPRIGIKLRDYDGNRYYSSGFTHVQNAVFKAMHKNLKPSYTVMLQRMPVKASADDKFLPFLFQIPIIFPILFIVSLQFSILVST